MTTDAKTYTEEQWIEAKRIARDVTDRPVTRILGPKIANPLSVMRLWNLVEQQWNGPWNLSFPGELQRYLAKRDDKGRTLYALEPPKSPVLVQPPAGSKASGKGIVAQATVPATTANLDDPQRSGRSRRHRGHRRRSDGS